jgi:basic amino acid/polyamine antiporter, APA family
VYLRDAFGPLPAFLYGWTYLVVVNCGGIAAVGVTFAGYFCRLALLPDSFIRPVAVLALVVLHGVNWFGIRPGAFTTNVFTVLRLGALGALIATGLAAVSQPGTHASDSTGAAPPEMTFGVLGAALIPVLFTYGGWQHSNHVAGEIREPERNLPRALWSSTCSRTSRTCTRSESKASRNRRRPPRTP